MRVGAVTAFVNEKKTNNGRFFLPMAAAFVFINTSTFCFIDRSAQQRYQYNFNLETLFLFRPLKFF